MNATVEDDLLSYYARHFRSGMVDLSESSPAPAAVPSSPPQCALGYQAPDSTRVLRRAIAARYVTLSEDDIVVTNGASEALAAVAFTLSKAGTRVFTSDGTYPTFKAVADMVGALNVASPGEAGLVLCTNPTVPGGQPVDIATFMARAATRGARVVVDEVYRELALTGPRLTAACDLDPRAVSIGDLSKPLGLGGLRIGWVATRDAKVLDGVRRQVQLLSGGPASPSVPLAELAAESLDILMDPLVECARQCAARTYPVLRARGWSFEAARAGLTVLARPPRPLTAAALQALREAGWFLLPSEVFGIRGGFRVSVMQPDALSAALTWLDGTVSGSAPASSLIVLTKNPGTGRSKTRLAAGIGDETAQEFARAFVRDTLSFAQSGPWHTTVAVPAPGADRWLRGVSGAARFIQQPQGDLGARIGAALSGALQYADRAVLIASDTPDLPRDFLVQAFDALESVDVVVGSARDGGFYLLGMKAWRDGLFADIEWSTGTVCERLLTNVRRLELSCWLLPEWDDVDDADSLRRLASRLGAGTRAPETSAVLRAWRTEAARVS